MIPAVALEVFVLANQIPNLLRRLFAEGAFSQAFVPVVAEYRAKRTTDEVRELVDSVAGTLGVRAGVSSVLGRDCRARDRADLRAGISRQRRQDSSTLAVEMLRWTFPYLLFVSLTALAGGVLNSYQKFALPAFSVGRAEHRDDRLCGVGVAVFRAACDGAGDRRIRRWHIAGR